ncbi:hypothetical protein [Aquisphaera insulae]|uniref:hypothetical protein n=1 Tax=Aquisphaera insulae TaxID=2712864 RepID=UPI0013ED0935|nr:hypothetical protein [Aquisphaera insulae]
MRRWAFLLSMLAALAGTPLRQAEAASDLARSLAELIQPADIEAPDGGVGDDAGLGTLTASHMQAADTLTVTDLVFLPPPASPAPSPAAAEGLRERVWWPQDPPALRHAWLNVFRF